jgi:shikimate kinase
MTTKKQTKTDAEIERREAQSISEIIELMGESHFRKLEADWLQSYTPDAEIISTGGGFPCFSFLMLKIRTLGPSIYLRAKPETILERLSSQGKTRPLIKELSINTIEAILERREKWYSCADLTIDTDNLRVEDICKQILTYVEH